MLNLEIQNSDFLPKLIQNFLVNTAAAETNKEVFWAITKNFIQVLQIEDCVVYEAFPRERVIKQRAAHGNKNPEEELINNNIELDFGIGIAGWVAEHQETTCVGNIDLDDRYIFDYSPCKSELCVPIQFNGELFGVIDSENSQENYFTQKHIEIFELIAELAANLLVRIRQKNEIEAIRLGLEENLFQSKINLNQAIEEVSDKISLLRIERENREVLTKEVHHRVNNNLQILNSIIRIFLSETEEISRSTLEEIQQKIQALSAIHLILLKSLEKNKLNFGDFLKDLTASIKYLNQHAFLSLDSKTSISFLGIDTLIPLGLLINEIIQDIARKSDNQELELIICISPLKDKFLLEVNLNTELKSNASKKSNKVSEILIDALTDQLEGEIMETSNKKQIWKIIFSEQL